MENRGIPLGFGIYGIEAYIPNKGFIMYNDLTQEDLWKLKYNN